MSQFNQCIMCESKRKLKSGTSTHRIQVGSVCFDGELPALICPQCDETYIDGVTMHKFELSVAKQLAENAQRTPEAFRFMRKVLGLRAIDLADIIGVSSETISRYENGARDIDPIRFGVLATLIADKMAGRDEARNCFITAQKPNKRMPRKVLLKVA